MKHLQSHDQGRNFSLIQEHDPYRPGEHYMPNNLYEGQYPEHYPWDYDEERKYQKRAWLQLKREDQDTEFGYLRPDFKDILTPEEET